MIRVLIADDHPVFLDGLGLLLDSTPGIEVVGAAADGAELLDLAARSTYDVVVVDLDMPGTDGATATRELLRTDPDTAVLVLTMHDDDESVQRALRAGARGYVLKGAAQGAIARAITALADGDTVLHGDVAQRVLRAAAQPGAGGGDQDRRILGSPAWPALSAREGEILDLVARGLSNKAIADRLFLAVKTVQNRVSDLLAKTASSTRAELVARPGRRDRRIGGAAAGPFRGDAERPGPLTRDTPIHCDPPQGVLGLKTKPPRCAGEL